MQAQPQSSALTYPHGSALRFTPAGLRVLGWRMGQLCAQRTQGPELTKILNRELGVNRKLDYYWKWAKAHGLEWTPAQRIGRPGHRVAPVELLPKDQQFCKFCEGVRAPVPYQLSGRNGTLFLCATRCCPECGAKLEVHEIQNKATGKVEARHWSHPFPMPPRKCLNPKCGVEFVPTNKKNPHQEGCSKRCTQIISVRRWEKNHPEKALDLQQRSSQNRQRKVKLAEDLAREVAELKAHIQPKRGPGRPAEPEHQKSYFRIGKQVETQIPKRLKGDKNAIVAARRLVSEKTRMPYDLIAQYHKTFRQTLSEGSGPRLAANSSV